MNISEKVAYLKGLVEGYGIDETQKEGKLLKVVVDILDDIALTVADVEESVDQLYEEVNAIDEDLEEVEEAVFGDEDEDDEDEDGMHDEEMYEVQCPNCSDLVYLDEDMIAEGEIQCPGCGEPLEFDLDFDECDCEECKQKHDEE